ncbi:MAG: hypothetical protein ABR956_13065 [Terracidiphilus sp.]
MRTTVAQRAKVPRRFVNVSSGSYRRCLAGMKRKLTGKSQRPVTLFL